MHDPSKVVNNATDLVLHGSTHLHASEAVRFQETGAATGVAKTMRVESLDAGLLCYGEPTAFPTTAGTAVSEPFGLPDLSKGAVTILEFPYPRGGRGIALFPSLSLCPRGGGRRTALFPSLSVPVAEGGAQHCFITLCPRGGGRRTALFPPLCVPRGGLGIKHSIGALYSHGGGRGTVLFLPLYSIGALLRSHLIIPVLLTCTTPKLT